MIPLLSFVGRSQNVASDLIMIQHDLLSKGSIVSSEPLSSVARILVVESWELRDLGKVMMWFPILLGFFLLLPRDKLQTSSLTPIAYLDFRLLIQPKLFELRGGDRPTRSTPSSFPLDES